jgi:tetratricopeptide (TPR) repeat protein
VAFNELEQNPYVPADLFRIFSFLHPEGIPLDILTEGSQGIPGSIELHDVIESPVKLEKALAEIRSGSLAQLFNDGKCQNIWIHDLVHYFFRQYMWPNQQREWAERAIDVVNFAYPHTLDSLKTWETAKRYLRHALACTEHAEVLQIQSTNLVDLMVRMSWFLRQTGDLPAAERLAVRAVNFAKVLGESEIQHMNSISNLGLIYCDQSRFKEAREQWQSALKMGSKLLGKDYVDTGLGNNLAQLCYQEGNFKDAERYHLNIFRSRTRILGEHHPETLGAMGSLANTYHFQGRLEEAVALKKKVLEGRRKHMGKLHPETLGAKGSLATTYSDLGRFKEAEELQEQIMEERKKQWGEQNPESLSAKGALSYTFYLRGYLEKAETLQQQVLDGRTKLWGEQNLETLGAIRHLAKTYHRQGRLNKAAELQEKVVFGMEKLLGEDNPGTLSGIEELSTTYRDQGRLEEAAKLTGRVTKEREGLWGKEHREIMRAMDALSRKRQGFAH